MNIAFSINRLGLAGLGATVSSLLRNCSDKKKLSLWFLCADITNEHKNHLVRLLHKEQFSGSYHIIDFDPHSIFGSFPSLHGDWSTYGRLLLVDYIDDDQVLYLDSDLVVELDVLEVDNFNFKGRALAAVGGGKFKYTLGNKFYINSLGLHPDLEYFNAGVLLFNLKEWRKSNVKEQCLQIARQNPLELPSHDQSLLNIFCAGNFAKLPKSFNCEWLADKRRPNLSNKMIIHFVGSPKPWDAFGFIMHNGYQNWLKYVDKDWAFVFVRFTRAYLRRAWKIRRSYVRCLRNKITN